MEYTKKRLSVRKSTAAPLKGPQVTQSSATATNRNDLRRTFIQRGAAGTAAIIEARESQTYAADGSAEALDFTQQQRAEVVFDADQLAAMRMLETEQFAIIAGYAGTGKTTLMKGALETWKEQVSSIDWDGYRSVGMHPTFRRRPAIALCTFTNVAAKNLASKLPEEWSEHCMSIHSMLAFRPVDFELSNGETSMRFEPAYCASNKLPLDILVVDEMGIVSTPLWHQILDACQPTTRVYFLGDLAQLPAMHGASPMPFAMRKWPTAVLDKIYRQKEGGRIIENLTHIRRGLPPIHAPNEFRCEDSNFDAAGKELSKEVLPRHVLNAREKIGGYISSLFRLGFWDPRQDMIITPTNAGMLGQLEWNGIFKLAFNPKQYDAKGKELNPAVLIQTAVGTITLALGDKVMATTNGGRTARENRFTNGSIGIVIGIRPNEKYNGDMTGLGEIHGAQDAYMADMVDEMEAASAAAAEDREDDADEEALHLIENADEDRKVRQASHIVTVIEQSTGDKYELSRGVEVATLTHAYAVTANKFQGSQARNVLVICHGCMPFGLNREWLYTACSRAQKKVFLLNEPAALTRAIENTQLPGRNAFEKADLLIAKYQKLKEWAIPRLPAARKVGE